MTAKTFPYTAWRLMPSFKPVKVEIVKAYGNGLISATWHTGDDGRQYAKDSLFDSEDAALVHASQKLTALVVRHEKMGKDIVKKRAVITAELLKRADEQR